MLRRLIVLMLGVSVVAAVGLVPAQAAGPITLPFGCVSAGAPQVVLRPPAAIAVAHTITCPGHWPKEKLALVEGSPGHWTMLLGSASAQGPVTVPGFQKIRKVCPHGAHVNAYLTILVLQPGAPADTPPVGTIVMWSGSAICP